MTRETDTIQHVLVMCNYVEFHSLSNTPRDQEIVVCAKLFLLCRHLSPPRPDALKMLPEPNTLDFC